MAVKNGIGYSPLTDKVYLGKQKHILTSLS